MSSKKGFRYVCTIEDIRSYRKLPAEMKLKWLDDAIRFCTKAILGKVKKIWDDFRAGKI